MNNTELALAPIKIKYWYMKTYFPTKWFAGRKLGVITYYEGITMCIIEQDSKYAVGISKCSKKDQFNKKIARSISYGRAIKALNEGVLYLPASEKLVGADWNADKIRTLLPEQAEQLI